MPISQISKQDILEMDAIELGAFITSRHITSREAVEVYIEHIDKTNPLVNFLVEDRFEKALEEADEADLSIQSGSATGKLVGVPISMKESFHVRGMQTTGGLPYRKGKIEEVDAEIVRRLQAEGAIILGKTNTPALCFCQETDNKVYGRTNNPRDLSRTVGGSSGGEGAAIALGAAAAGIGSDIGGSIRFPSHFNGVVGFKSGNLQVSSEGSYPAEEQQLQQRMLGIGPITKSVRDAKLLYSIIAKDPPATQLLDSFTINILPETGLPLSPETKSLLDQIASSVPFQTVREVPPYFFDSAPLWQEIMSIDGASGVRKEAFGEKSGSPLRAYVTEKWRGTSPLHPYLSWALIGASLFKPSKDRVGEIERVIERGDVELAAYLDSKIIISPVYHCAAPPHGTVYRELFSIRKTFLKYIPFVSYANVWGLPSLTVPVGKDSTGMPIGVQVMSKVGNEAALFAFGEWLESSFTGYERAELAL